MAVFLDRLRRLVLDERETTRQETFRIWSQPLPVRVAQGRAIEGVSIESITTDGLLHLRCDSNTSRFRESDTLNLNRGNPFDDPRINVTIESDDETRLTASVEDWGVNWQFLHDAPRGWVLDEGYLDLSQYILEALNDAGDKLAGRERILPLLMGHSRPAIDHARYERILALADAFGLNWEQGEALAHAYATDLVYLIQGPPGTGKTRVLAHLAQLLVEDGERVLVTAFTHRAINNILNTLAEVAPHIPAIKIGQRTRADDLDVENYEYFAGSPMEAMSNGYVIGATPFAPRTHRLNGVEFDTILFDEASQITLPLAVMGMLAGKKYIFIGDHKQLPPVLTTRFSGGAFRDSIFGTLTERGFDTMLAETYRLNAELTEWPSQRFYGGALKPAPSVAGRRIQYSSPPSRLSSILEPSHPKVFVDLMHRNTTTRSHKEASVVVDIISTLLGCGVPAHEIGVVVPYRAQAREIRNWMRRTIGDPETLRQVVVDTVERMQGQERDLIIVSLTTSNPMFAADLAEFFFQPERLNVAVTRPRKKLIIVGSSHVLRAQPEEPELQESVALLRDLLNACTYRTLEFET